ncbi:unnamed protein product [Meloidogyne enterolobii]|uniref:Uncharacterized protein n=1 Tax=Meloidogyne enterolobii TaxID=390850 RepID=A0ACB1B5W8_MELEN
MFLCQRKLLVKISVRIIFLAVSRCRLLQSSKLKLNKLKSTTSEQQTETEQAKGRIVGGYHLRATPQAPTMDDYHTTFPLKLEKLPPKPKKASNKPFQKHRSLEIREKILREQNKLTEENTEKELSPALSVTNPELANNQEIPTQVLPPTNVPNPEIPTDASSTGSNEREKLIPDLNLALEENDENKQDEPKMD